MQKAKTYFFSIVVPCLNEELALPKLLTDLSKQSYQNFEVTIVDAKSEDKTISNAKKYAAKIPHLKIISSKKKNVAYQRNLGAKKARGPWIVFMDADNRIPTYFLQGLKYKVELLQPKILTTALEPDSKNPKDKSIASVINAAIDLNKKSPNPIVQESMMVFEKSVFDKLGGFNDKVYWGEGAELLSQAHKKGITLSFVRDPKYVYSFRRIRKQGTLNMLRNIVVQQIAKSTNSRLEKEISSLFYPMEGGSFYKITPKNRKYLRKIFEAFAEHKEQEEKESLFYRIKQVFIANKNTKDQISQ